MQKVYLTAVMLLSSLLFLSAEMHAQQRTITGKVISGESDEPIPGVNILLQGTTVGTVTNIDGEYSINVPGDDAVLSFSSIGFDTETIEVGNQSNIDVVMMPDLKQLSEVVVTAFGIEREEKSLSYSVSQLEGEELTKAREVNVANSLAGKVAGVQVGSSSGGPTSASQVIIRGNSSLAGNNQPLYVIDGVPMDNSNLGSAGRWGGIDRGDGISNINPDDIKSISVLKGPNAAALYGQRGANGVILITTKSGVKRDGIGVNFNSNFQVGTPLVLPDYQNVYGQGNGGNFTYYRRESDQHTFTREAALALDPNLSGFVPQLSNNNDGVEGPVSWGPRMDGRNAYTWDGELLPYAPQPNNVRDYYELQQTFTNTLSLNGGNEQTTFYFSASNMDFSGMLPNNDMRRLTFNLRGTHEITDKIHIDVKANYINQYAQNRPVMSDGQQNVAYLFRYMPRNLRTDRQQQYEFAEDEVGRDNVALFGGPGNEPVHIKADQVRAGWSRHWSNGTFTEQPYWAVNNVYNEDTRQRLIGMARVNYDITDHLKISGRAGTDFYTDQWMDYKRIGTRVRPEGDFGERVFRVVENNSDILVTYTTDLTDNFYFEANVGAQRTYQFNRQVGYGGREFKVDNLFVINNINNQRTNFGLTERRIHSLYAFGQFGYKNMLFLDWTARNDWSSTLNPENNSYFYPSLSSSFVFTDAFEIESDVVSFGKVRASWAQAGNSGDPYQIFGTYSLLNLSHGSNPLANYTNSIPFFDLKNELTTSVEVGLDMRFFNGRAGIDFTYYDASTENQILNVDVSTATGYQRKLVNAGEIRNYGVELMLSGRPFENAGGFTWDIAFNYAQNNSEVIDLADGVDRFRIGVDRNVQVFAEPGRPYGEIWSIKTVWLRDDAGNRLIGPDGLPIRVDEPKPIGNALPDWLGGLTNDFSFKNISLHTLLDIRQGGQIFSMSNVYEAHHGTTQRTLEGREGDLVLSGIKAEQNADGEWVSTGETNDIPVRAEIYWREAVVPGSTQAVTEEFLNDASYVALREVSLTYRLPQNFLGNSIFRTVSVSLVGRNLGYLQRNTDGFSPEASAFNVNTSAGGALGMESASFPMARTFGVDLSIGF